MADHSPKFSLPIFLIRRTEYLNKIITMAGLLKYFKPKQHHEDNDDEVKPEGLPDPNGNLSKVILSSSITRLYARHWRKNASHVAHIFQ